MTTPIIHPINAVPPVFPCWLWNALLTKWNRCDERNVYALACATVHHTHWSPDSPLPPEVTPERPRPIGSLNAEEAEKLVDTFWSPASGPSPAALAAAKEILMMLYGSGTIANANADACAAIIDRKFPREEAIVHLTAELLRMCAKADGKCRKLVNDPTPDIEASDFQHAVMALEKYGDSQQLALHHGWLSQVKDGLSARAALQDSREGKSK